MVLSLGNFYYMFYIVLGLMITFLTVRFLKTKTDKFRFWFIFGILAAAFLVHFLKIFIYPYTTLDNVMRKVTLENVCAVSVVLFPFIYFSKNKFLKDYMILVGLASGLLTFIYPIDAISPMFDGEYLGFKNAFSIEVFRFYFTHLVLFLVPFLMMHFKMHTLSVKRSLMMPVLLLLTLLIIYINELIITQLGWVPRDNLYDPNKRNPSLIFGVKDGVEGITMLLMIFVPAFLTVNPISGTVFYWPVIWLIIPIFIYGMIISLSFYYIYDREQTVLLFRKILRLKQTKDTPKDSVKH